MHVALIIVSGDIEAIDVPAEILVSVSLHTACPPIYGTVLSKTIVMLEFGKKDVLKDCHS